MVMVDPKMSPRRSSRARQTQPTPSASSHSLSSSSVTSSHGDRSMRSNKKQSSSRKSASPPSSDGDGAEPRNQLGEQSQSRRRKRAPKAESELDGKIVADIEDEFIEEEEVTRCVCGQMEYPGPPLEMGRSQATRDGHSHAPEGGADANPDDGGGLFIQCDICKVWQHGGCVGIMNEATSPEEYFCEQCRKDLHQLKTNTQGQKYSQYLPVYEQTHSKTSRKHAHLKENEPRVGKEKEALQLSKAESFTKRRSTMNSRAAYDEDEVLRKVIEESKGEGQIQSTDGSTRRGKRSRDDNADSRLGLKRQRTGSTSPTSHSTLIGNRFDGESDIEGATGRNRNNNRKARTKTQDQGEQEMREREKAREREKSEAAGRRKGRAERRRGDGESVMSEGTSAKDDTASQHLEQPEAGQNHVVPPVSSQQSGNRQTTQKPSRNAKNGRTNRNQYTRDRDKVLPRSNTDPSASHQKDYASPSRKANDASGVQGDGGSGQTHEASSYHAKNSRTRHQRSNLNDMRKRVAAMLEFISRVQLDMAHERPASAASSSSNSNGIDKNAMSMIAASIIAVSGGGDDDVSDNDNPAKQKYQLTAQAELDKPFAELSSLEMMDVLTRNLVLWQKTFGKTGEK